MTAPTLAMKSSGMTVAAIAWLVSIAVAGSLHAADDSPKKIDAARVNGIDRGLVGGPVGTIARTAPGLTPDAMKVATRKALTDSKNWWTNADGCKAQSSCDANNMRETEPAIRKDRFGAWLRIQCLHRNTREKATYYEWYESSSISVAEAEQRTIQWANGVDRCLFSPIGGNVYLHLRENRSERAWLHRTVDQEAAGYITKGALGNE